MKRKHIRKITSEHIRAVATMTGRFEDDYQPIDAAIAHAISAYEGNERISFHYASWLKLRDDVKAELVHRTKLRDLEKGERNE